MFQMSDEKLIERLDQVLRTDEAGFNQGLNDFFGMYIPNDKPVLEALFEILTQRDSNGSLEFSPEARRKTFDALTRQLEGEFGKLAGVINTPDLILEIRSFSNMLKRSSVEFCRLTYRQSVDDGEE